MILHDEWHGEVARYLRSDVLRSPGYIGALRSGNDVEKATEAADNAGGSFFLLLSGIAIVVGVIALIVYLKKYKAEDKPKLKSTNTLMNTTQMFKAATASPAMIASILIFCIMAVADRIPV
jgi:hypothetical protein